MTVSTHPTHHVPCVHTGWLPWLIESQSQHSHQFSLDNISAFTTLLEPCRVLVLAFCRPGSLWLRVGTPCTQRCSSFLLHCMHKAQPPVPPDLRMVLSNPVGDRASYTLVTCTLAHVRQQQPTGSPEQGWAGQLVL